MIKRVIRARHEFSTDSIGLYFIEYAGRETRYGTLDEHGQIDWSGPPKPDGWFMPKPAVIVPREMLAEMISELSNLGVEPDASANMRGKLEATQAHLADMRTLVFKTPAHVEGA